uniref:Mbeg1-like protein n=1 Tax=Atopobacter phocae TaxID=136492 RepID=UPI00055530EB
MDNKEIEFKVNKNVKNKKSIKRKMNVVAGAMAVGALFTTNEMIHADEEHVSTEIGTINTSNSSSISSQNGGQAFNSDSEMNHNDIEEQKFKSTNIDDEREASSQALDKPNVVPINEIKPQEQSGPNIDTKTIEELKNSVKDLKGKFDFKPFYQKDEDGDGIIDVYDNDPKKWDVTDRDLRFFMELAYHTENQLTGLFEEGKKIKDDESQKTLDDKTISEKYMLIKQFNQDEVKGIADIREIVPHWDFVKQINDPSNGFSASIFKNNKQAVVAFRGTDSINDAKSDASIALGWQPGQVKSLNSIITELQNYDSYYLTGHSLGGYLAQYLASSAEVMSDSKFKHTAVFNAPGIAANYLTWNKEHVSVAKNIKEQSKKLYLENADKRYNRLMHKLQPYSISFDVASNIYPYKNIEFLQLANSNLFHTSLNFFPRTNGLKYKELFSTGYRMDKPYADLDTDGDGIKDIDELRIGTNYLSKDTDGDGYDDHLELLLKSSPFDSNSIPENKLNQDSSENVVLKKTLNNQTINIINTNEKPLIIKLDSVKEPIDWSMVERSSEKQANTKDTENIEPNSNPNGNEGPQKESDDSLQNGNSKPETNGQENQDQKNQPKPETNGQENQDQKNQ